MRLLADECFDERLAARLRSEGHEVVRVPAQSGSTTWLWRGARSVRINALWEHGDKGLMIIPASIPLHDPTVQAELTRYLEQKWDAIISADVDGPNATPLAVDRENPNLQRYGAARRVARTIFMASAPTYGGPNPGIDDRRIRLGCAQPGETPGSFGDALRRLADRATYLYVDGGRYWLSTQPSVTRTADDRAAALQADDVWAEL